MDTLSKLWRSLRPKLALVDLRHLWLPNLRLLSSQNRFQVPPVHLWPFQEKVVNDVNDLISSIYFPSHPWLFEGKSVSLQNTPSSLEEDTIPF